MNIHITGMENVKGQQAINSILDSVNNEIDNQNYHDLVDLIKYDQLRYHKLVN